MKSRAPSAVRLLMIAATALALLAGCATGTGKGTAWPPGAQAPADAAETPLTAAEQTFVIRAALRTMYELEVSRLAAQRATDPRVRAYAQQQVARQSATTDELITLMSVKNVPPPRGLPTDRATKLHRLASLKPSPAFDTAYVRVVGIEDQRATIQMLEHGRRIAKDRDLRAWIDRMLPALRRQLEVANTLAGSLAG